MQFAIQWCIILLVYIRHAIKRLKATFYPVTVNEKLAITKPQRNGEYQKGRVALDRALATDIESNGFKMKTCKYFTDGYKVGAHFDASMIEPFSSNTDTIKSLVPLHHVTLPNEF